MQVPLSVPAVLGAQGGLFPSSASASFTVLPETEEVQVQASAEVPFPALVQSTTANTPRSDERRRPHRKKPSMPWLSRRKKSAQGGEGEEGDERKGEDSDDSSESPVSVQPRYRLGDLVVVSHARVALVRYVGEVFFRSVKKKKKKAKAQRAEQWYGLELLGPSNGVHDGKYQGIRYYKTAPNRAVFLRACEILRRAKTGDFEPPPDVQRKLERVKKKRHEKEKEEAAAERSSPRRAPAAPAMVRTASDSAAATREERRSSWNHFARASRPAAAGRRARQKRGSEAQLGSPRKRRAQQLREAAAAEKGKASPRRGGRRRAPSVPARPKLSADCSSAEAPARLRLTRSKSITPKTTTRENLHRFRGRGRKFSMAESSMARTATPRTPKSARLPPKAPKRKAQHRAQRTPPSLDGSSKSFSNADRNRVLEKKSRRESTRNRKDKKRSSRKRSSKKNSLKASTGASGSPKQSHGLDVVARTAQGPGPSPTDTLSPLPASDDHQEFVVVPSVGNDARSGEELAQPPARRRGRRVTTKRDSESSGGASEPTTPVPQTPQGGFFSQVKPFDSSLELESTASPQVSVLEAARAALAAAAATKHPVVLPSPQAPIARDISPELIRATPVAEADEDASPTRKKLQHASVWEFPDRSEEDEKSSCDPSPSKSNSRPESPEAALTPKENRLLIVQSHSEARALAAQEAQETRDVPALTDDSKSKSADEFDVDEDSSPEPYKKRRKDTMEFIRQQLAEMRQEQDAFEQAFQDLQGEAQRLDTDEDGEDDLIRQNSMPNLRFSRETRSPSPSSSDSGEESDSQRMIAELCRRMDEMASEPWAAAVDHETAKSLDYIHSILGDT